MHGFHRDGKAGFGIIAADDCDGKKINRQDAKSAKETQYGPSLNEADVKKPRGKGDFKKLPMPPGPTKVPPFHRTPHDFFQNSHSPRRLA
jgi:hypothetical protein